MEQTERSHEETEEIVQQYKRSVEEKKSRQYFLHQDTRKSFETIVFLHFPSVFEQMILLRTTIFQRIVSLFF
jgi:hypothetical protein